MRFTPGFRTLIVPSSVTKIKIAGPEVPFPDTTKSSVPLKTVPVGVDGPLLPSGGGMVTMRGT